MTTLIGATTPRVEDKDLLLGRARFVDDINPANLAAAAVVRSPHAHAAITGADASAALAMPGVDRKSTRLNSSHSQQSRMPSSA